MKKLKSYKIFLEELNISYNKDIYLNTINLYHCGDHIYAVVINDQHSRAMVFIRPQEFYESIFDEIVHKQFKFNRYMDIYKQHYGKQEFTYGSDWSGFNIPSNILEECMFNIDPEDINTYDKIMLSVIKEIKKIEGDNKYYLLGVDKLKNDLLEHEFAHAMYFTLPDYKSKMDKLTSECDENVKRKMFKSIVDYGYADHVLSDEMQAYMATGLGYEQEILDIPNIEIEMKKYNNLFNEYYSKNLYKSPQKIKINFEI